MEKNYCGTWACSQYLTEEFNMPAVPLSYSTIRQTIRTSIGAKSIRVKFSNICGDGNLELKSVHIAKTVEPGTVIGKIDPSTDTIITFEGKEEAVIPQGKEIYSDTFSFEFEPLTQLSISIYYGTVPSKVTGHPGSRTTSCIEKGNIVSKELFGTENTVDHWYTIAAVDAVQSADSPAAKSLICFGDSITDGRGSTTNMQNRWTDNLATILQNNSKTKNIAVINQGIGGTLVGFHGVQRFDQDVLSQCGITQILMLYGINDIIYANMSAEKIIEVYKNLISKAHQKNIKFMGSTILPFGKCADFNSKREEERQSLNRWIRQTKACDGGFDSYVDFDKAMQDPENPVNMKELFDCGDGLHPSAQGYVQMAEAVNLTE